MNRVITPAAVGRIDHLFHSFVDLLLPPVCAHCGRIGVIVCPECLDRFPVVPSPICACCGRMLEADAAQKVDTLCGACLAQRPLVAEARAPFLYDEPVSGIIHRLKYEGHFAIARVLGRVMADCWPAWHEPVDVLVPVPLHARRRRQRGFNQAELLARTISRERDLPLAAQSVRRERHTLPQINLNPAERAANVAGAFVAVGPELQDQHVLLIDDVYTTGATMNATAAAVVAAGARRVSAYCVARVS